jgi:hypothetical protein
VCVSEEEYEEEDASATPSGIKREWYVCMYFIKIYCLFVDLIKYCDVEDCVGDGYHVASKACFLCQSSNFAGR